MFLLWRSNEEIFWFRYYTFFAINICACSQNENLREESTSISIPISDYTIYSGTWTSNGYAENYIYTQEGGAILSTQIEENHLEATYVYVQNSSYRIASVENIDTEIMDSVAEFDFEDDGWGNSGKVRIVFGEQVSVEINELEKILTMLREWQYLQRCLTEKIVRR